MPKNFRALETCFLIVEVDPFLGVGELSPPSASLLASGPSSAIADPSLAVRMPIVGTSEGAELAALQLSGNVRNCCRCGLLVAALLSQAHS